MLTLTYYGKSDLIKPSFLFGATEFSEEWTVNAAKLFCRKKTVNQYTFAFTFTSHKYVTLQMEEAKDGRLSFGGVSL